MNKKKYIGIAIIFFILLLAFLLLSYYNRRRGANDAQLVNAPTPTVAPEITSTPTPSPSPTPSTMPTLSPQQIADRDTSRLTAEFIYNDIIGTMLYGYEVETIFQNLTDLTWDMALLITGTSIVTGDALVAGDYIVSVTDTVDGFNFGSKVFISNTGYPLKFLNYGIHYTGRMTIAWNASKNGYETICELAEFNTIGYIDDSEGNQQPTTLSKIKAWDYRTGIFERDALYKIYPVYRAGTDLVSGLVFEPQTLYLER